MGTLTVTAAALAVAAQAVAAQGVAAQGVVAKAVAIAPVAGAGASSHLVGATTTATVGAVATADTLTTLADFAWLEGSWRGPGPGGGTAEIHYMSPTAGVLPSVFRLWNGERVLVLEALTLVEDAEGVTLYVRHFTSALEALEAERPLTLKLVARDGDRFFFENMYDENPRRSVIERTGPDAFLSWSELLRDDGSTDEIRVEYRRAEDTGGA